MLFKNTFILLGFIAFLSCSPKIIAYTYVSGSMGGSNSTYVKQDSIYFTKMDRHGAISKGNELSKADWKSISKISKTIDLNGIDTIQSPTNRRQVDAAPYAYLVIETKDSIYQSASFDGGKPPIKLESVVNSIIKLANSSKTD